MPAVSDTTDDFVFSLHRAAYAECTSGLTCLQLSTGMGRCKAVQQSVAPIDAAMRILVLSM